ncbi:MspA family porin [Mycolicibacterium sp. ND9-15]|uniref:MspA family porin n=1 Tax=Mycolicibacterium sp. ND9-15 TaxID=3042320 RepID=UPI002DD92AC4|nr:MspA family porin [Mycolicibacterium sp. ND9-15]WSE55489.1 MspA family porin [Mycolicibacterium sp. ND9-15]
MTVGRVLRRGITGIAIVGVLGNAGAALASAEPDAEPIVAEVVAEAAPPPVEGAVESTPPAVKEAPDGWRLEMGAKDETQAPIPPLTTALSSREYEVGGTYMGSLTGPEEDEPPQGALEVGYEIGCGIDMSTSNGVSLTGTAGISPSIGILGIDAVDTLDIGILPSLGGNLGGGITVGLKPGLVNVIPVTKKEFTGAKPWVMVSNFRVKIDGCVGESFIRSYAFLTRSTDESEAIVAWYGVTKKI